jgi:hypothetical protein
MTVIIIIEDVLHRPVGQMRKSYKYLLQTGKEDTTCENLGVDERRILKCIWIHFAQGVVRCSAVVNAVKNYRVP